MTRLPVENLMVGPKSFQLHFQRRPLWWTAWATALGIVLAQWLAAAPVFWGGICAAGLCLWGGLRLRRCSSLGGTCLGLLVVVWAAAWWEAHHQRKAAAPDRLRNVMTVHPAWFEEAVTLTGRLAGWPEPAPRRIGFELELESLAVPGGSAQAVQGRVRLTLVFSEEQKAREWERLHPFLGARLRLEARLTRTARYQNPGGFEYSEYLEVEGVEAGGLVTGDVIQLAPGTETGVRSRLGMLRLRAFQCLERDYEPRVAGMLMAAMFGSRSFLDAGWAERFRSTNTFHLLVISGSHVVLLGWAVAGLLGWVTRQRAAVAGMVVAVVWAYTFMVGGDAPVMRAAIGLTVWQVARFWYRSPDPLNTVGCAVCVLLWVDPAQLLHPGFQLTVGAVVALVAGVAPLVQKLEIIGRWRPTRATPYPPNCVAWVRGLAEILYWSPSAFAAEMQVAPVTYRLEKNAWAGKLERFGVPSSWRKRWSWAAACHLQTVVRWIVVLLLASGTVQLALLPLSAFYFNRVAPVGLVTNLVAEVAMGLLMVATGFYFAAVMWGGKTLAVWLVAKTAWLFVGTTGFFHIGKWGSWRVPHLSGTFLWVYVAFALGMGVWWYLVNRWQPLAPVRPPRRGTRWTLVLVLAWTGGTGWLVLNPPQQWFRPAPGTLRVTFLDVGQGDATLLEFPSGESILVDSGGRREWQPPPANATAFQEDTLGIGERVVSRALWARGIRHLTAIVGTHADADHIQAFGEVVKNFPIGTAYCGRVTADAVFANWKQTIDRAGIPLVPLTAGKRMRFGSTLVEVLAPAAQSDLNGVSDNDASLVLAVRQGAHRFLLTGDIEKQAETELRLSGADLRCDVLKAPHHGSHSSSTSEFVLATHPVQVVFCAPRKSPYGHPHADVVARYQQMLPGVQLWQTGIDGAVTFETDGERLQAVGFASGRRIP
ncbi:MAG: ComEC/Rec2 family competence protein [Blastocatellia bacterium]|nr:ComEC/Rec2 family competence protein [Blastocatellia bacterium]